MAVPNRDVISRAQDRVERIPRGLVGSPQRAYRMAIYTALIVDWTKNPNAPYEDSRARVLETVREEHPGFSPEDPNGESG